MDLPVPPDQSFLQFNESLIPYIPADFVNTDLELLGRNGSLAREKDY